MFPLTNSGVGQYTAIHASTNTHTTGNYNSYKYLRYVVHYYYRYFIKLPALLLINFILPCIIIKMFHTCETEIKLPSSIFLVNMQNYPRFSCNWHKISTHGNFARVGKAYCSSAVQWMAFHRVVLSRPYMCYTNSCFECSAPCIIYDF